MSPPIDFNRERKRRRRGGGPSMPPKQWLTMAIIVAAVAYALARAWQMWAGS